MVGGWGIVDIEKEKKKKKRRKTRKEREKKDVLNNLTHGTMIV